jgi:hypothetical protein
MSGTIFQVSSSGTLNTLYDFENSPSSGLVSAGAELYGTTGYWRQLWVRVTQTFGSAEFSGYLSHSVPMLSSVMMRAPAVLARTWPADSRRKG